MAEHAAPLLSAEADARARLAAVDQALLPLHTLPRAARRAASCPCDVRVAPTVATLVLRRGSVGGAPLSALALRAVPRRSAARKAERGKEARAAWLLGDEFCQTAATMSQPSNDRYDIRSAEQGNRAAASACVCAAGKFVNVHSEHAHMDLASSRANAEWQCTPDWSDSRALRSARRYGCAWSHPSAPTRHVAAHTAQSVRPPPRSASPPPLTPMLAWQREHALPSSSAQKRACAKRPVRVLYSAPHSAHGQPRPFDDGRARTSMRTVCSTLPRGRLRTCEGGMGWPAASTLCRRTRTLRECAADGPVQSAAPGVAVDTD
eukprot:6182806-Pleurochrysis_carterae.AAC.1